MFFLSIPAYFNPTQMVKVKLNWEVCLFVVTRVGVISFSPHIRAVAPLGVLEVLLWYILFPSGWERILFKIGPLKLGSVNEIGG